MTQVLFKTVPFIAKSLCTFSVHVLQQGVAQQVEDEDNVSASETFDLMMISLKDERTVPTTTFTTHHSALPFKATGLFSQECNIQGLGYFYFSSVPGD